MPTVADTLPPAAPHVPLHLEHFAAVAADSAATTRDSVAPLPPVMYMPVVPAPEPAPPAPLSDNITTGILLAAVLFAVVSYRVGRKYVDNIMHNLFSTRRRENLFEDHTFNETQILVSLVTLLCVAEGTLGYMYLHIVHSLAAPAAIVIPSLAGVALLFYLLQLLGYMLIGHVFLDEVDRKLWLDGFKSSQALLGVMLLPVAVCAVAQPALTMPLIILAAALFVLVKIAFITKGCRIFLTDFAAYLPFILYLCAVEIAPVVATLRATWLTSALLWS